MIHLPKDKKIVLFDGVCNLCSNSVQTIIKYDKKNIFLFAALQSEIGKKITSNLKIDTNQTNSVILLEPNVCYDVKSTAVLKIMNEFGGIWKLSQLFFLFPEKIRNFIYNYIAKNRYKWFGKKESCTIAKPELKAKFLEYLL